MTEEQTQRAFALWSDRRNTAEIAKVIGLPEHVVEADLRRFRENRREAKNAQAQHRAAKQRYADKLQRCGFPAAAARLEVEKMEMAQ